MIMDLKILNVAEIYDSNACSPTLNTCGGGNHEPKIIDDYRSYER